MVLALLVAITLPSQSAGEWTPAPEIEGLTDAEVRAVEVSSDGSVWLGVRDRGLARVRGAQVEWVGIDDGLVSHGIAAIHEDRSGRVWAAGADGLSVLEGDQWVSQSTFDDLRPRVVFDVHEDTHGQIWLGANGGAARQTPAGWELVELADGLPHSVVHAVVMDQRGAAWFACRRGLGRGENGAVTVFFPEVNFRAAALAPDGTLWFGTPDGLYTWDGASWDRHQRGQATYPILVEENGAVWAGSSNGRILRHYDGAWLVIELPANLQGAEIFDLAQATDGSIWVATSRGAARYDPSVASGR